MTILSILLDLEGCAVNLTEIFGQNGLLSQAIFEFTPRESQQKMAEAIEKAIEFHSELIVEAGTGTGKTFGYLIPIFLSQKKTIISTGTKNLQDQLFFTDIPVIKKIFSSLAKQTDDYVKEIIAYLKELNLLNKTMVIYRSNDLPAQAGVRTVKTSR